MPFDSETLIELFKFAPAVLALLLVIFWLFRLLNKQHDTIKCMMKMSDSSTQRQAKLLTLLEILVNRKSEG